MKKCAISLLALFMVAFESSAQTSEEIQELLRGQETGLENESEKLDQNQEDYVQFDAIEQYTQSPLQLNISSEAELRSFPFFNENQIQSLLEHRNKFGKLISIEELQVIDGFNAGFIQGIKPMLSVGETAGQKKVTGSRLIHDGVNTIMFRYQKNLNPTIEELSFPGIQEKLYLRYKYQLGDRIRFGLTAEKDPGEYFFQNKRIKGFDFYSGHLIIKSKSLIRQITIGDYAVQHGQGLVMWSGMGLGKSTDVIGIQKTGGIIKPYTSVDENNFLRGICISTSVRDWNVDLFYSSHRKDGNLQMEEESETISSFQTSGYHRTDAELEDRKSVNERIVGAKTNKSFGRLKLGGIAYITKFSKAVEKENSLYNQFEFRGSENFNYGLTASYLYKNTNSFAEIARSLNGGMAYLAGSLIHLHPKLSYSFVWRKYDVDYQALQSAGFAENSKTANENGFFSGIQLKFPKNLMLSAYADYFVFPWLKFGVDAPSSGNEYLLQLKWKPKRTFESYLLFKTKTKEQNSSSTYEMIHTLEKRKHSSIRWNIRIKLNETWEWGSRLEHSFYKKGNQNSTTGFVLFQDILFHPLNSPVSFGLRYALFDTDDYDTRIYAYENDVLFSYSIPAMQGRGERMYLNMHYRLSRLFEIWLRYATTTFSKENPDSEVPLGVREPKKDLKIQIRFRF